MPSCMKILMRLLHIKIENIRLLKLAESRADSNTSALETFVKEQGFSTEELSESVELE